MECHHLKDFRFSVYVHWPYDCTLSEHYRYLQQVHNDTHIFHISVDEDADPLIGSALKRYMYIWCPTLVCMYLYIMCCLC